MKKPFFKYEERHLNFLRENFRLYSIKILVEKFNIKFETNLTQTQINSTCKRYKIQSGRTGRFTNGSKPWNTGKKGVLTGSATSFRKGNKPHNWCPIGSERFTKDDFIRVKIAEPNVWEFKHRLVWESEKGKIPSGMAVIFKDGNRENCLIDNLDLVSRGMLAQFNRHKVSELPDELKGPMRTLVAIKIKQGKRIAELNEEQTT